VDETRFERMLTAALELRSLIRMKIADDADLDSAQAAIRELTAFFDALFAVAASDGTTAAVVMKGLVDES
jgi:hypothetical protein